MKRLDARITVTMPAWQWLQLMGAIGAWLGTARLTVVDDLNARIMAEIKDADDE